MFTHQEWGTISPLTLFLLEKKKMIERATWMCWIEVAFMVSNLSKLMEPAIHEVDKKPSLLCRGYIKCYTAHLPKSYDTLLGIFLFFIFIHLLGLETSIF